MAEILFTFKELRKLANGYRKAHVRLASPVM